MKSQKSFLNEELGCLYLIPTPIGNLEDMTFRAVRILKEVDYIAAEDTRNSKKLCNHFEIPTPLVSYHEHNKEKAGLKIIEDLKQGLKVGLVSDAGMPCINDPGYELVQLCLDAGISVIPLPGANAALTSLISSGLPTDSFLYIGFLARQKRDKKKQLEPLKGQRSTVILYESPHRLKETLQVILEILGDRKIVLCRELTKKFEEFLRGTVSDAIEWSTNEEVRGEFVVILEGASEEDVKNSEDCWWEELTINQHVDWYINEKKEKSKDAIKLVAKDRSLNKRDVYAEYHEI
ncbi:16S rRNA (cytidine(1402)-2'-O)-methyltransferase [Bacillus sp. AFS017336]|uniref:16S rRNA (cytidine(1402)-2'-O)-methyltransferase n=1 Tax=Bacillus sp. AFS017336 TaxID=2033489 RepID=UPI000BF06FC9|nr:16S rRNA (cytidine(1402)-2'-O)-methyltransferase [Bacillus sp. AFS017336]PEL10043.1 16S rRNA (cytidine(1402)-2'-O)-methyltransferase [Bacillus sp. AFS017336]